MDMKSKMPRLKQYKEISSLLCGFFHLTKKQYRENRELKQDVIGLEDGSMYPIASLEKIILKQKVWGFSNKKTNSIHIWVHESAGLGDIVHLLGHEVGHLNTTRMKRLKKEEYQAELFGEVTEDAFTLALRVDKKRIQWNREE